MSCIAALTHMTELRLSRNALAALPQLHPLLRLPRLRALALIDNPINALVLARPYAVFRHAPGAGRNGGRAAAGLGTPCGAAASPGPVPGDHSACPRRARCACACRLSKLLCYNDQPIRREERQDARRMFGRLDAALEQAMVISRAARGWGEWGGEGRGRALLPSQQRHIDGHPAWGVSRSLHRRRDAY